MCGPRDSRPLSIDVPLWHAKIGRTSVKPIGRSTQIGSAQSCTLNGHRVLRFFWRHWPQSPLRSSPALPAGPASTREEVERSIREGVRFLKEQQNKDGSWNDLDEKTRTGMTSLVTLALLTAGEKPKSPEIHKALEFLRKFGPEELGSTYAIGLQTMVYAGAEPDVDQLRIAANVSWLEQAQIQKGDRIPWPGSWSYSDAKRPQPGDNSNTQYAPAGVARRQRSRSPRQGENVATGPRILGKRSETRRKLGLYTRERHCHRQHDVRGDFQPSDHRTAPVRRRGIRATRGDP